MNNKSKSGSLADSFADAVTPSNILTKIFHFFVFGVLTATPYLVKNLDGVVSASRSAGAGWFGTLLAFFKALAASTWTGVGIALNTIFTTLINFNHVIADRMIGTLLYTIVMFFFATLLFFQPLRLLFNIMDAKQGREHSKSFIFVVSVVVVILASALTYAITDGDTITSGISDSGSVEDVNDSVVPDLNVSVETNESDDLIAVIDLVGGS